MQFLTNKDYGIFKYAIINILSFYYRYCMYLLLIIIGFLSIIFKQRKDFFYESTINDKTEKQSSIKRIFAGVTDGFRYIIDREDFAFYLILNIIIGTLSLLYFAKCSADGYKYCQDILAPSFFILAIYCWNKIFSECCIKEMKTENTKKRIMLFVLCIVTLCTFFRFDTFEYSKDDVKTFSELDEKILQHNEEMLFLGVESYHYIMNHNLWENPNIYLDEGHIRYFNHQPDPNSFLAKLFYNEEVESVASNYVSKVNDMLKNKEFGLVTMFSYSILNPDILRENYYLDSTYNITNEIEGTHEVQVWLPKQDDGDISLKRLR